MIARCPKEKGNEARSRIFRAGRRVRLLLPLFILMCLDGIMASTVRQVTVQEMVSASSFVFEGYVAGVEPRMAPDGSSISTLVTFRISEVLKGSYPDSSIRLSYLGGTVGNLTLVVADVHAPRLGEHGIYFVESLTRAQIHPLYGWDQGHFVVQADPDGIQRVRTRGLARVIAVESGRATRLEGISHGTAAGVRTSDTAAGKGMTVEEFKKNLHEIMRGMR
jgi:hypothetical protein